MREGSLSVLTVVTCWGGNDDALEISMRATRRIDELRRAQKETIGLAEPGRPPKNGSSENPISKPTLASQGIDKNLAPQR